MKKLICTILTLCTLLCSLPLAAFADNGVKASIEKCTYTDGNINRIKNRVLDQGLQGGFCFV